MLIEIGLKNDIDEALLMNTIIHDRNQDEYIENILIETERNEESIMTIYKCHHKDFLIWLKRYISINLYNELMKFYIKSEYNTNSQIINYKIYNDVYELKGDICIKTRKCHIRILKMTFKKHYIPDIMKTQIMCDIGKEIRKDVEKCMAFRLLPPRSDACPGGVPTPTPDLLEMKENKI
jgi:hypothetical protein